MEPELIKLRPAQPADHPALFALHCAVFRPHIEVLWGWDEDWQRANFAAECAAATTCVIEVEGRLVGYLQTLEEEGRLYVQNIAMAEQAQGQGIGARLLQRLQFKAAGRGLPLQLGVFRSNTRAQRFYERLGFLQTGTTETHIEMSWSAT
ncbi:N-acetyltransferase family protein [Comamonas sp. GB3 AK4-5]|uniref:GNAT family N-acetyltransferase n=1 Tax=Comamonas sp. GB3 AK4-5 TaxID=3231487 RepID=UPI00351E9E8A